MIVDCMNEFVHAFEMAFANSANLLVCDRVLSIMVVYSPIDVYWCDFCMFLLFWRSCIGIAGNQRHLNIDMSVALAMVYLVFIVMPCCVLRLAVLVFVISSAHVTAVNTTHVDILGTSMDKKDIGLMFTFTDALYSLLFLYIVYRLIKMFRKEAAETEEKETTVADYTGNDMLI